MSCSFFSSVPRKGRFFSSRTSFTPARLSTAIQSISSLVEWMILSAAERSSGGVAGLTTCAVSGKPLVDLQKGLAAATERYPWLDGERACALGASYGGFMMSWIAGRWPERFRCLVNHDGVFDQRAMYYSTEELWFPEREHGAPEYQDPKAYAEADPARFVNEWRTPMLVIHGSMDYRVPETQGLATFTALQRRGIPSRYVSFPEENHWVLAPANSLQWHAEVESWLARWLAPAAGPAPTP
mgnify:CR=1 FL=1